MKKKKGPRERIYKTEAPLYTWADIECIVTSDVEKSTISRNISTGAGRADARTAANDSTIVIILRENFPIRDLAHEAVHAASFILKRSGVRASLFNDEPIAYLTDWIVDWIARMDFKRRSKRKSL